MSSSWRNQQESGKKRSGYLLWVVDKPFLEVLYYKVEFFSNQFNSTWMFSSDRSSLSEF